MQSLKKKIFKRDNQTNSRHLGKRMGIEGAGGRIITCALPALISMIKTPAVLSIDHELRRLRKAWPHRPPMQETLCLDTRGSFRRF
jgi:hypothetical protein